MKIVIMNKAVENKILNIRKQQVILDSDVAELYGVSTKEVNQAVSRNSEKFPHGYLLELSLEEKTELVTNCDRFNKLKHSTTLPKAFTERGLYMLATILKSHKATDTTIAIIDTFAKVREISRTVAQLVDHNDEPSNQKLNDKVGHLIGELIMPDETDFDTESIETTAKLKFFSMLEITRKIVKKPKKPQIK